MTNSRKLAVVTGASSGIGLELALQFADNDFDLVICAEDAGLAAAADRIRERGAQVTVVQRDLRLPDGVEDLYAVTNELGRPVDAAAVNAGVGRGGVFWETPLADLLEVVDLDVRSTVHLTRLLLADMVARNEGRLLLTSSIASTMPGTYQAVYNAGKSFVQSLAEALQEELKDSDVTVTSLMPGPTETNFFHRAEMDDTPVGQAKKDDPAKVAKMGFDALMAGKGRVVAASLATKAQEAAAKVLPDKIKAKMHAAQAKPEGADKS
ncbi:MAG TPA: SDR family NAD(P)-dependent oxidoreductase [Propionibacteriaceae bacterium]|nr:SDR family NAD(P)-dependent oxidoreductase [Propionibacteriaceae bacterium]